jgi:uncharacterized protein (TIGR02996 family)
MDAQAALLAALHTDPADELTWQALADCLEERGQAECAELLRLTRALRSLPDGAERQAAEGHVGALLAAGVRPCVPVLTNSIGMRLALIPAGRFLMGSASDEKGHCDGEWPRHEVEITRPFYLGVHPVTQEQYRRVVGVNPSYFSPTGAGKGKVRKLDTDTFPVEWVSWEDASAFCRKLAALGEERWAGRTYRLPTEAEWEYACRASMTTPFYFGSRISSRQANFDGNFPYGGAAKGPYLERPTAVGSFPANGFGLHEMHGNVFEWCGDWYASEWYRQSPKTDPDGPATGHDRVLRGGSCFGYGSTCRASFRFQSAPRTRYGNFGFRVVCTWPCGSPR